MIYAKGDLVQLYRGIKAFHTPTKQLMTLNESGVTHVTDVRMDGAVEYITLDEQYLVRASDATMVLPSNAEDILGLRPGAEAGPRGWYYAILRSKRTKQVVWRSDKTYFLAIGTAASIQSATGAALEELQRRWEKYRGGPYQLPTKVAYVD